MLLRNKVFSLLPYASAVLAAMTVYCTSLNTAGTSEVGNPQKVSAVIVDSTGKSVADVPVSLVPVDFNSLRGANGFQKSTLPNAQTLFPSSISDESGRVEIQATDTGMYNLVATSPAYQYRLFVSPINVGEDTAVNLGEVRLREPGTVAVTVDSTVRTLGGTLVVPGSIFSTPVGQSGTVSMMVPAGQFSLRYLTSAGDTISGTASLKNVIVGEGQTVLAAIGRASSAWNHSIQVRLNTTAAGANVAGTVRNFPALVRLNSGNFNFAEATADGSDIRFAKANGAAMPYEIERWDATASQAEIWVRVDTVYGNDSTHYLTMYWGASTGSATVSLSNGAAVFDTANGFQGVWHLGQSQTPVLDATVNQFNGTMSDTAPSATTGIIGACQQFNGTSNYIQMTGTARGKLDFPEHGTYALSAWVYTDTLDTLYQRIICKNNFQYKLQIDYFKTWSFAEFEGGIGYELTSSPAIANAWVYVVGVRSGSSQYLYVNGLCVDSTIVKQAYIAPRDTTSDVTIGRSAKTPPGDPCFFKGKIDEARLINRALSADWVKLEYMNQKAANALVKFK